MKLETDPALKASKISVTFSAYKAPTGGIETLKLPQKFIFKFRFFTFDEQFTDPLSLANVAKVDEKSVISSGSSYFLQRASSSNAYIHSQPNRSNLAEQLAQISFTVDPSASRIEDEHERLANYLKERYLTIDVYDAITQFYFGSTKVPLFDLLR